MNQTENQTIPTPGKLARIITASLWVLIVFTIGTAVYINARKPVQKMALTLPDLTPNVEQDTAKAQHFVFNAEKLQTVLPKIARHYHMEVVYTSTSPELQNMKLTGNISQNADVNETLEVLRITLGIRLRVEDHKIMVSPNPYL